MKIEKGLAWPDADRFMVEELAPGGTYQLANLAAALRHVTQFATAIDGGAHVGTWSRVMAGRFATVIAFEPSQDTFDCLTFNLAQAGLDNVRCMRAALGAEAGHVTLALDAENEARANTGARFTRPGGTIPVLTIDSLALTDLGFLKLDIEGSEPAALEGASKTLTRCRPIVLFENKRLWARHHGRPKDAVVRILERHRYRHLESVGCDQIWGPA
jgi:FkbM family methyltransferase